VSSPGDNELYIEATLDNTLSPCNSSPSFSSNPQLYACVGQTVNYQQLAFDSDGDSLVYSLTDALQNTGTSVTYAGGYGGINPLTVPVVIDPVTDQITFTPNTPQVPVFTVLLEEYRNGVLIATVMRDVQCVIQNCSNTIPEISGINGVVNDYEIDVCVGTTVCFDININRCKCRTEYFNVHW